MQKKYMNTYKMTDLMSCFNLEPINDYGPNPLNQFAGSSNVMALQLIH